MTKFFEDYSKLEFAVIPLHSQTKKASIVWGEFQNRKPTGDELNAWFNGQECNLAIVTGTVSGVVVIDFDGEEGEASRQKLNLPKTPTVRTAHGRHLYFKHPGFTVRNTVRVMPGVDVRGDGAYAVAPPSSYRQQ